MEVRSAYRLSSQETELATKVVNITRLSEIWFMIMPLENTLIHQVPRTTNYEHIEEQTVL